MMEVRVVLDKGVCKIYGVNDKHLNRNDKEIIKYALDNYGFVNKKINSYYFDVTVKEWIDNIKTIFSESPRTNEVIRILTKIS